MAALYWGWVVCVCFLVLFTLSAGVAFSFTEILVPLSQEIHAKMSILGKCISVCPHTSSAVRLR